MPLVSVIIPTYNRSKLLQLALESVLTQTYPNIEIIVVDDGSTDDTRQVVCNYGHPVVYLHQENAGPAAARNKGIKAARGEFIAFLDSDDTISPNKLALQVSYLETHPDVGVVYSGWQTISEDGKTIESEVIPDQEGEILKELLLKTYLFPIHAALIRRNCIDRVGLFDETLPAFEDPDFWLRVARMGCKFACIKQPLCRWRMTSNSLGKNLLKLEQATPVVLQKVFDDPELPADIVMIKDEVYARRYLAFGLNYFYATNGDQTEPEYDRARYYLAKGLALKPTLLKENLALLDLMIYEAIKQNPGNPEASLCDAANKLFVSVTDKSRLKSRLFGRLHITLAFQANQTGHRSLVASHILHGLRYDPSWLRNRGVPALLVKSLFARFHN